MEDSIQHLSIPEFLMKVREGGAIEELRDNLEQLNRSVILTGKPGSITLKISVKPNGATGVMVKDDIKVSIPVPNKEDTLFFVTEEGGLTRRDPRQPSLAGLGSN